MRREDSGHKMMMMMMMMVMMVMILETINYILRARTSFLATAAAAAPICYLSDKHIRISLY